MNAQLEPPQERRIWWVIIDDEVRQLVCFSCARDGLACWFTKERGYVYECNMFATEIQATKALQENVRLRANAAAQKLSLLDKRLAMLEADAHVNI